MKTCRKGLHQYEGARCSVCKVAYDRRHKDDNIEEKVRTDRAYREAHVKTQEQRKAYRAVNGEKLRASVRASYRKNPLSDSRVAAMLGIPVKAAPPSLIELKREQLMVLKLIKELQNEIQHC